MFVLQLDGGQDGVIYGELSPGLAVAGISAGNGTFLMARPDPFMVSTNLRLPVAGSRECEIVVRDVTLREVESFRTASDEEGWS